MPHKLSSQPNQQSHDITHKDSSYYDTISSIHVPILKNRYIKEKFRKTLTQTE